jgi:short-subunit dehydrogenase
VLVGRSQKKLDQQAEETRKQYGVEARHRRRPLRVYHATKSYMTGFSNAPWRELKDTGVSVTCLMPGTMPSFLVEVELAFLANLLSTATRDT